MGFVKKGKGQKKKSSSGNKDKHRDRTRIGTVDKDAALENNTNKVGNRLQNGASGGNSGTTSLTQEERGNGSNERDQQQMGNVQLLEAHGSVERATPYWTSLTRAERERTLSVSLRELRKELEIHIAQQQQQQRRALSSSSPSHASSSARTGGSGPGEREDQQEEGKDGKVAQALEQNENKQQQQVLEGPAYLKVELERGLARLKEHGTWKAWIPWEGLQPQAHNLEGDELRGIGITTTATTTTTTTTTTATATATATCSGPSTPQRPAEFYDGDEFRHYLQSCYPKELLDMLLERDWNSKLEFEAETQLRLRMQDLLQLVNSKNLHCSPNNVVGGGGGGGGNVNGGGNGKDAKGSNGGLIGGPNNALMDNRQGGLDGQDRDSTGNGNNNRRMRLSKKYNSRTDHQLNIRNNQVELITLMLEALDQEHELLYHAFLFPVTEFVCEKLEPNNRESSREELFFEDLEKLSVDDVGKICEFLTEKIDGLSSRMKPGDNETENENEDEVNDKKKKKNNKGSESSSAHAATEEGEVEEDEGMGDVDLFQLDERPTNRGNSNKSSKGNKEGEVVEEEEGEEESMLVVNPKWLQHLEERCLSEDGNPTKVGKDQDPDKVGLVLDWVYGSIVSTAEKSRDAAWKQLGHSAPDVVVVYETFLKGLLEQYLLEKKRRKAKCYLEEMVKSRKLNQELTEQVMEMQQELQANKMVSTNPSEDLSDFLPDHIIYEMMKREKLLTDSKLYALRFEQESCEKKLTGIKGQLRQAEPEFERIKRELAEMKSNPKPNHGANPGDGTYRNQAEMERHRAQLQDAAIEEQLEVQTGYREQGMQLKVLYGKRQQCEMEMNQNDTQIKQLSTWRRTIEDIRERFGKILEEQRESKERQGALESHGRKGSTPAGTCAAPGKDGNKSNSSALSSAPEDVEQAGGPHEKLRAHFHKEIRRQLYTEKDDRQFFDRIKTVVVDLESRINTGYAALSHMETIIVNLACDDPGAMIGSHLLLPRHQRNIDLGAQKHMQKKAQEAEDEILRLEVEAEMKKSQERERKQKKRNKQKEEKRLRLQAEKKAKEDALQKAKELELKQKQEEEERTLLEKQRRQAELELRRKMEEEIIERRRAELEAEVSMQLSDPSERPRPTDEDPVKKTNGQDQASDGFIVVEKRLKSYKDKNDHQKKGMAKNQRGRKHQNGKVNTNSQPQSQSQSQPQPQPQPQFQSHRRVAGDEPALPRPTGIRAGPGQHQQSQQKQVNSKQQKAANNVKAASAETTAVVAEKEEDEQMPERESESKPVQVMKSVQVGTDAKEDVAPDEEGGQSNNLVRVMEGEQDHMTDAMAHQHLPPPPQMPPLMPAMPPLGMQPGLAYYSQPFPGYMPAQAGPQGPHPAAVPHMMPYGLPPPVDPMNHGLMQMQPSLIPMPPGNLPPPPFVNNGNMPHNMAPFSGVSPPQMIGVMPGLDPTTGQQVNIGPPFQQAQEMIHLANEAAQEMLMNVNAQPFVPPKKLGEGAPNGGAAAGHLEQTPPTPSAQTSDLARDTKEKKHKRAKNPRKGNRKWAGGAASKDAREVREGENKSNSNSNSNSSKDAVKTESKTCPCGLVDGPCV